MNPSPDIAALAAQALKNAYTPYGGQAQGAALRLKNGRLFSGATIENAAFSHSFEAVEAAIGAMVAEGAEPGDIAEIYCAGSGGPGPGAASLLGIFAAPQILLHTGADEKSVGGFGAAFEFSRYEEYRVSVRDRREEKLPAFVQDEKLRGLFRVRRHAFCPVSFYAVGAMIETSGGEIFYGCNIETGYNHGLHAEGVAIAGMISALGPSARIARVTVLTAGRPGFPCGGCRQNIHEFAAAGAEVTTMNLEGERMTVPFSSLLPHAFGPADLDSAQTAPTGTKR